MNGAPSRRRMRISSLLPCPLRSPEFAEGMHERCSDLELHRIENVGHWLQQEAPTIVNERLIAWLTRVAL